MPDTQVSTVRFKSLVKHGRLAFAPGTAYGFEDPDAAPYFIAAGWAEASEDAPDVVLTLGEIDIDPKTVKAGTGAPVIVHSARHAARG